MRPSQRKPAPLLELPAGSVSAQILRYVSPSEALAAAPIPALARSTIWVVASMFGALLLAAGLIKVDRVVSAVGRIVPVAGNIVVQPLETAIVRSIEVKPGQRVLAGDMLARLDPTFAAADAGAVQSQVKSLEAETDRLRAELAETAFAPTGQDPVQILQAVIFNQRASERNSKLESFQKKIEGLQAAITRSLADAAAYRERSDVAASIEEMRKSLEQQKVGSRLNLLLATDSRLEAERRQSAADQASSEAKSELAAMQADRESYLQSWRAQTAQTLSEEVHKLSDARELSQKMVLRRSLVELHAEHDAIVQSIAKVSEGSVLQAGQQFITLVPADSPLEVEVSISGRDIGFVRSGDATAIKFDTFPYARFGMAHGKVRMISPDSVTSAEQLTGQLANAPQVQQPGTELFYRSRIAIDEIKLHSLSEALQVTAGMPVVVDIKVGQQTILGYLVNGILVTAREGLREP